MNEETSIYYRKNEAFQRQQAILEGKAYRKGRYLPSQIWHGSKANILLIRRFQEYLFGEGTGEYRVAKVTSALRIICDKIGKNLDALTKADVVSLVAYINTNPAWKEHSKSDYRRTLKQFYKWYEDEDIRLNGDESTRQEIVKLYKYLASVTGKANAPQKDPQDMLTEEDCQTLLNRGAKTSVQKALVSTLHATGVRVGELLSMRISDVHERSTGLWVHVNGKTGRRPVPLGFATHHVTQWLNEHPNKDDPKAQLWVSVEPKDYASPFQYIGVLRLLKRVASRSGITKPCNPHNFRHSRETIWSQLFTEAEQCLLLGWRVGSRQPSTYTHLSPDRVEAKFGAVYGLTPEDKRKPEIIKCQVCDEVNSSISRFCLRCGRPMNMQVAIQQQSAIDEAEKKIANLTPEEQKLFMQLLGSMARKGGAQ